MSIEILDGTLTPKQPSGTKRGYGRFEKIRIQTADGNWREFGQVGTGPAMTAQVIQGGAGRYYFSTADGPFALFGVRRPDGSSVYAHHSNAETFILVMALFCTMATVGRFAFEMEIPILGTAVGPLLLLGWYYLNHKKQAARRAFVEDNR